MAHSLSSGFFRRDEIFHSDPSPCDTLALGALSGVPSRGLTSLPNALVGVFMS
jgi:hypothetical protein